MKNFIEMKNRVYVKAINLKTLHSQLIYRDYKSVLNSTLISAERNHHGTLFKANTNKESHGLSIKRSLLNVESPIYPGKIR